ncbi:ABC transporter substrate-binding protein [Microbacterium immunditiarum]|uniref:Iron(III) transport system substrate-binding protein n=1 Tax=Microbacterium immunditiarum TaxID=337480 RepID=A0A7Y9GRR3_9MICO|nr:extracellular solute-binding protein [Microbacterium immunditiarum]NYE21514.1 iron(III) transport system substrate-binding protein [Microbacterium immunditiarum]
MRTPRRKWMGIAGIVAAVALIAGCSSGGGGGGETSAPSDGPVDAEWEAIVEAAKEEGKVVWYTVAPETAREGLKEAFEAKYPEISVDVRVIGTADMTAALEAEHSTGAEGADVVTSVNFAWLEEKLNEDGWFTELEGPVFEDPEWTDSGWVREDKLILSPLGLLVVGWNTQLFNGEITSYEDLLDPAYGNGAIGVVDPAIIAIHADWYQFLEDNTSDGFLEELAKQEPTIYASALAMQEGLLAGEIAIGTFVSAADMSVRKEEGAPIEFTVPDPVWGVPNVFLAVESAKNPNAAQVFLDFFASEEGQRATAHGGATPLSAVQPDTIGASSNVELVNPERVLDLEWWEEYTAKWNELFR